MTITQLIQSSPANANDLFARIAETTSGAVKTRESLFNELKAELELHARREEEHLFPALRKHKETKDLVRAAVDDNKQARGLLAELDAMPKDSDDFIAKVAELRKAFQQHVRDEKKELLPAVKAALSSGEAQAIADKVEADKAAIEQGKTRQAEERRAAAREEREKAARRQAQAEAREQRAREEENRKQAEIRAEQRRVREGEKRRQAEAEAEQKRQQAAIRAEQRRVRAEAKQRQAKAEAEQARARQAGAALARTGENFMASGQTVAAAGAAAAQAGTEAALRNSGQIAGALNTALGQTGALIATAVQTYSERAAPALQRLEALASLPPVATGAAAETGKTWFELMGRNAESRARRSRHLMQSFTPQQAAQAQARYLGDSAQAWFEANARMLDISIEAYRGMTQTLSRGGQRDKDAGKPA
jgi:hypothetical protein